MASSHISSVQFSCSVMSDYLQPPWIAARQASLSITNSWSSPKVMCIESVMPSSHLILCHPLLLLCLIPPSFRVFSNESTLLMRWSKCLSFSLSISPFDFVDHSKLWKFLKKMGLSVHLTCLLRNLSAGQEATVRTGHGKTDWFHIGKRVHPGCILSPAYLIYMQSTS